MSAFATIRCSRCNGHERHRFDSLELAQLIQVNLDVVHFIICADIELATVDVCQRRPCGEFGRITLVACDAGNLDAPMLSTVRLSTFSAKCE